MKFKILYPLGFACLAFFLIGASDLLPHATFVQGLGKIVISACILLCVIDIAKNRNIKFGDWTALFILIIPKFSLIIWLVWHLKWRAYLPIVLLFPIFLIMGGFLFSGLIIGGMFAGYSFSSLVELFFN